MENCQWGTLGAAIDASSTKFPTKTIASWAEQIYWGLAHIHGHHFTHLKINIEPENIFVTEESTLKLGGFGAVDTSETLRYKCRYKRK
ncbi:unnamed protein product, partial [Mesorhabditis belari]|uniref:Protein kinase domain-containing protein n=1 Tax=Mesorhabditis belari TaxID=2138241 RepID=A0AAF3E7X5_9BILA